MPPPYTCRIDFESRSPVDIGKAGAWLYSMHPETEILCKAYEYRGTRGLWVPRPFEEGGLDLSETVRMAILRDAIFEAHNAFFEQAMWENICVKRWGWPPIPLEQWRCTASVAAAHSLPRSLDGVGTALGLLEQKDKEGHRIMLKLCKPRKPSKNNPARYFTGEEDYRKLYSYCCQDVSTQGDLSETLPSLSPSELEVWRMDQRINFRGVHADRGAITGALNILEQFDAQTRAKVKHLTNGRVQSISEVAKIKKFVNDLGVNIDGIGKPVLKEVLDNWEIDPLARELLELRQAAGRSSTAKYQAMLTKMDTDDRIRETIIYHGAHSGRWTGRGIQPQNFPKGSIKDQDEIDDAIEVISGGDLATMQLLYDDPMDVLASCLRAMLCAAPGHRLLCADYSAIEACWLSWLCDEEADLRKLRQGLDVYKVIVASVLGKPIEEVTAKERDLGKVIVLAAGYQMGEDRFYDTCLEWGITVTRDLAKKTIKFYRKTHKRVVKFWRDIERAASSAVTRKGKKFRCGKVVCQYRNKFLFIELPSGRELAYYDPKIKDHPKFDKASLTYMGMSSQSYKWERTYTYGGKLTENIVQAGARDVMAEAMLDLEVRGYPIVLTVHDEVVSEVREDDKTKMLSQFCGIMATVPRWAQELPLSVNGWEGKRFRK